MADLTGLLNLSGDLEVVLPFQNAADRIVTHERNVVRAATSHDGAGIWL